MSKFTVKWAGMKGDPVARFWARVDKRGPTECWNFSGKPLADGHCQISVNGRRWGAHRYSAMLAGMAPPDDKMICHKCNNPRCVNPAHLYVGTAKDNARDSIKAGTFYFPHPGFGEDHPLAKLTKELSAKIREECVSGASYRWIAKKYGISASNVGKIVNRETWA